MRMITKK